MLVRLTDYWQIVGDETVSRIYRKSGELYRKTILEIGSLRRFPRLCGRKRR